MTALRVTLLPVGLVLCGLAVVLGLPLFGARSWLFVTPAVLGTLAVVVSVVAALRARAHRGPTRLLLECALAVAFVVLVQGALIRIPTQWDFSSDQVNTLASQSVEVSKQLSAPVQVRASLATDDRAYVEVSTLVSRYVAAGAPLELSRDDVRVAMGDPNLVFTQGNRRVPVRIDAGAPNQEERITNALLALVGGPAQRVYVVAGHGEREVLDVAQPGLSRLAEALVAQGLVVVSLPLDRVAAVPDDAAAVIVAGPTRAVPAVELARLQTYLAHGGRLLALLEHASDSGALEGVVGAYGLQLGIGTVSDDSALSQALGGGEMVTGAQLEHAHPVTAVLGDALTHFQSARAVAENPGTPAQVTLLVRSAAGAVADGASGTFALVGAAEQDAPGATAHPTRIVLAGDVDCATNRGMSLGANRDLLVNAVMWLVDQNDRITLRPTGRTGALLLLTPTARERLAFVLLYALPASVVAAGFFVRARRRAR